jgi:hypothetical protein
MKKGTKTKPKYNAIITNNSPMACCGGKKGANYEGEATLKTQTKVKC